MPHYKKIFHKEGISMIRNFKFEDVKRYLENKSAAESILEGFSTFADVALIFTPIVLGPQFLPLLEVLDAKDRLVDAGKKILSFIGSQTAPNYKEKMRQIDSAYITLSLTAFVEALNEQLPSSEVKEVIKFFKESDRFELFTSETEKNVFEKNKSVNIMFPNEVDTLDDLQDSLRFFYDDTCKNLINHFEEIISKLNYNETSSKKSKKIINKIKKIIDVLHKIPETALSIYIAQLIDLMSSFEDFSAYIQLREFSALRTSINESVKQQLSYDVGLKSLADLIKSIGKTQKEEEIEKICADLKKYYNKEIGEPIASNGENNDNELAGGVTTEDEHDELAFPLIVDAYISQAYKCLRYTSSIGLENPKVWEELPVRENIGDLFVNYLSIPQSVEYPLIVLGLPGSGKSILTKVLSAQLMNSAYTVVRIPLRDIDANNDIHVIISEQISKCIQRPLKDGYAGFAEHFASNPLFIIFDGYDELLQVKGDIFNGYISKIHEFQKEQNVLGRPVRVMVTSRITLIDKVKIPKNSVIVNLEAFDQQRRNAWINIWNNYNQDYFVRNNIKQFYLKDENNLSKNIKELAEQPLLLLMLALFDSYDNALESMGDNISRTHLYDELLRRICRREANKLYTHAQGNHDDFIERYVQGEMSRLGVVAIGMFNRKQLHIHTKDLLSDLLTYGILNEWGEVPQEADTLIRSFFFVHKSAADNENETKKDYAYEFLHNTFGEFLTADFILNYLVREAGELFVAHKNAMQGNIVQKKLYTPNGIGDEWFINLMFAPLYSRPLVIEMIREHLPRVLKRCDFKYEDFKSSLIELVEAQLKMFLEEKNLPQILSTLDGFKNVKLPLIGHISTYTLNITILASLLSDTGFTFDERNYRNDISQDSETSPWDKLTNLWKTWFSSDNLTGLARIIRSSRNDVFVDNRKLSIIDLKCPSQIDDIESGLNRIEKQLSVANALSDEITFSLCGLQTTRFTDITKKSVEELLSILKTVNKNLYVKYIINLIRIEIYHFSKHSNFNRINELIDLITNLDAVDELSQDVFIEYLYTIENSIAHHMVYMEVQMKIFKQLNSILRHNEYNSLIIRVAIQLFRNLDEFIDIEDIFYLREKNEVFFGNRGNQLYLNMEFANNRSISFFNKDKIIEYMRTDPNMVSRYLLNNSKQMTNRDNEIHYIIQQYLDYIFASYRTQVKTDIRYSSTIGIRTLIYSIKIASNVEDINYQNFAKEMVIKTIQRNYHTERLLNIILVYPELLTIISEYIPEIFEETVLKYFQRDIEYSFRRNYYYNSIYLALSYINFIRNIGLEYNKSNTNFDHIIHKIISNEMIKLIENNGNIYDVLTVNEYKNLLWYIEKNEKKFNKKLIEKIKWMQ